MFKDHLKLHIIVFIWGFTGILGTLITWSALEIVEFRMWVAALALLLFIAYKRKKIWVRKKLVLTYLLIGSIVALHWILFFAALKVSTVSVTLTTLSSATLFTAIFEPLFFRRKLKSHEVIMGMAIIIGLFIIFGFEPGYRLGVILALFSAACASLFTTLNGVLISKKQSSVSITFYEMLGGAVFTTVLLKILNWLHFSLPENEAPIPGTLWVNIFYLLILSILCTAIAFVVSVEVMKNLSPFTVSVSINMEPIYSIVLALLFFGQREFMSTGFYVGALLILGVIFLNAWIKKNQKRRALKNSALSA